MFSDVLLYVVGEKKNEKRIFGDSYLSLYPSHVLSPMLVPLAARF